MDDHKNKEARTEPPRQDAYVSSCGVLEPETTRLLTYDWSHSVKTGAPNKNFMMSRHWQIGRTTHKRCPLHQVDRDDLEMESGIASAGHPARGESSQKRCGACMAL